MIARCRGISSKTIKKWRQRESVTESPIGRRAALGGAQPREESSRGVIRCCRSLAALWFTDAFYRSGALMLG